MKQTPLDQLTPLQRAVTQEAATERAFANEYWDEFTDGIYVDIVSGVPLFSSRDKYDAGCGWPSFSRPIDQALLEMRPDNKLPYEPRTEVRSTTADTHLGHVFPDRRSETNQQFCINSAALRFVPQESLVAEGYGEYAALFEA